MPSPRPLDRLREFSGRSTNGVGADATSAFLVEGMGVNHWQANGPTGERTSGFALRANPGFGYGAVTVGGDTALAAAPPNAFEIVWLSAPEERHTAEVMIGELGSFFSLARVGDRVVGVAPAWEAGCHFAWASPGRGWTDVRTIDSNGCRHFTAATRGHPSWHEPVRTDGDQATFVAVEGDGTVWQLELAPGAEPRTTEVGALVSQDDARIYFDSLLAADRAPGERLASWRQSDYDGDHRRFAAFVDDTYMPVSDVWEIVGVGEPGYSLSAEIAVCHDQWVLYDSEAGWVGVFTDVGVPPITSDVSSGDIAQLACTPFGAIFGSRTTVATLTCD